MTGERFDPYVEPQLAPTMQSGDVIILDYLSSHKSPTAAAYLKAVGAWFLFLPPHSSEVNPSEMTSAKLNALIRRAAARTCDAIWQAADHVCSLFKEEECCNFLNAAGYETIEGNALQASKIR